MATITITVPKIIKSFFSVFFLLTDLLRLAGVFFVVDLVDDALCFLSLAIFPTCLYFLLILSKKN